MKKKRYPFKKLHKIFAGTLCLVVAAVALYSAVGGGIRAEAAKGTINYPTSSDSEILQYLSDQGVSDIKGLSLAQTFGSNVSITSGGTKTTSELTSSNASDRTLTMTQSYGTDAVFTVDSINASVTCNGSTITPALKDGHTAIYDYFYCNSKTSTTYYKTVTETRSSNTFSNFYSEVLDQHTKGANEKVASTMLLSIGYDRLGKVFDSAIVKAAEKNGYQIYTAGDEIRLFQEDGTRVKYIDMVTMTRVDLYFRIHDTDDDTLIRLDFDAVVYTTQRYDFSGATLQISTTAPTITLESGADLTTTKISPDDAITEFKYTAPTELEKLNDSSLSDLSGCMQYYLSQKRVTKYSDITDWKTWNSSSAPVLLNSEGSQNGYLYTRMAGKTSTDGKTQLLNSDVREYILNYLDQPDGDVTVEITVQEDSSSSEVDQAVLSIKESDGLILYAASKSDLNLTRVSTSEVPKEVLENAASSGLVNVESANSVSYIRVNDLWYTYDPSKVQTFESGKTIDLTYNKDNEATFCAMVIAEGKQNGALKEYSCQKLPEMKVSGVKLESGKSILTDDLSLDDRITTLSYQVDGVSEGNYTLQYYLGARNENTTRIMWQDWTGAAVSLNEKKECLYIRAKSASVQNGSVIYVTSQIATCSLSYIDQKEETLSVMASITASNSLTGQDTIALSASEKGALIFYVVEGDDLSFSKVEDSATLSALADLVSTDSTAATAVTYNSSLYMRVNQLWYQCSAGTKEYKSPFSISYQDGSCKLLTRVVKDGYLLDGSPTGITCMKLESPQIQLESGNTTADAVSYDDTIIEMGTEYQSENVRCQYYLSSRKMTTIEDSKWNDWTGNAVSLGKNKYLYTRVAGADSNNSGSILYADSAPKEYTFSYITQRSTEVSAAAYSGNEEALDGVADGDTIRLSTDLEDALIFYTVDGSKPEFTKVSDKERETLDAKRPGTGLATYSSDSGELYVRVNNLWYKCGSATKLYTDEIVVDDSIYKGYSMTVYAQTVADGYTSSAVNRFVYSVTLRDQTATPTADPQTGTAILMGDTVILRCATRNSKIYYTTDGSAPVVDENTLEPGDDNTKEYTGPISITENNGAAYGRSITITAQAFSITTYEDGTAARNKKDSSIARFTYSVDAQTVVQAVTSVPATTSDNRTEVEVGSSIKLYTGTEDAVIFYTLDGTEPVFSYNKTTSEYELGNDQTFQYVASKGIIVPEKTDSSLLTITAVAYKDGLASSETSRMIFQYPASVSAPYATPSAGAVTENTQVTLQTATSDAVIYYEVAYGNNVPKDPTEKSNVFDSSNPFTITKKTTIKAIAVKKSVSSSVVTFTYTVSEKLSAPTPSISSGSVVASGTVVELSADSGATIYYTTDGSDPKATDNTKVQVGESVVISGSSGTAITIRTYASKTGYSDSETGYYSYTVSAYDGGIYADKESGSTVKIGEIIRLNTDVSDATIYYTTDGSTPDTESTNGSSVTIAGEPGENVIVKAISVAEGSDKAISAATFTYTIMERLAAPTASVPSGAVFTEEGTVTLTAEADKIYYTTNGEDPTTASNLYKRAIVIEEGITIKAIAVQDGYEQSTVSTFSYGFADQVATPQASYASGELEMGETISFFCDTEDAQIYYRTDGTEPDPSDKSSCELYTGPITIERATNFKVIAVKDHMQNSKVLTVGYTVREPEIVEVEEEEEEQTVVSGSSRLQSRHSYSDTESGPSYSAVVLRSAAYRAVVSAPEDVLPDNVQLKVEPTQVSDVSENMVKNALTDEYGIVSSYQISLLQDGEEIQPDGEIEIGLPIPSEYENSIIHIVYVQEDGSIKVYDTRRSSGFAYAKVDHLSTWAIAAPVEYTESKAAFPWLLVIYSGVVVLAGVGILLLYRARKERKEGEDWDV